MQPGTNDSRGVPLPRCKTIDTWNKVESLSRPNRHLEDVAFGKISPPFVAVLGVRSPRLTVLRHHLRAPAPAAAQTTFY